MHEGLPESMAPFRRDHSNRLPTESYRNASSVKFLIQEDGSVSNVRITRSSSVADIDKKSLPVADGSQRIGLKSSFLAFGIKLIKLCVLDFSTTQEDALAGKPEGGTRPPRPSGLAPRLGIAEAQVNL